MENPEHNDLNPLIIDGPPWEKKHEIGFFLAFIETIKAFLFKPGHAFSLMRRSNGIGDALVYTVALQVFAFLWTFAFTDASPEMFLPQSPELQEMLELPDNISQIMVLIFPISVILLQFVIAFSVHLALKWRELQTYEFSLVFRIFAYAFGSAAVLGLVPVIGGMLTFMMTVYLCYLGLRTIYAIEPSSFVITALLALFIAIGVYVAAVLGLTLLLLLLSLIF